MKSIKEKLKNKQKNDLARESVDMNRSIEELSQKSESELMSELLSVANSKRKDGTLDNSSLEEFRKAIAPSLNNEQLNKLNEIIDMLKK